MQCIVVKSGEFENSYSLLYILLKILFMLLLARYARSAAINAGDYTAARRYEFYLRVVNSISHELSLIHI